MQSGSESGTERPGAPVLSLFRDDEDGFTTVAVAVALVLSLSLVFASASATWVAGRSSEVQRVADAAALAPELECASHRAYTTAYAFGDAHDTVLADGSQEGGTCTFIAVVTAYADGRATVQMRNRFYEGDVLEVLSPSEAFSACVRVTDMRDRDGAPCADAMLVQGTYSFACPVPLAAGDILRRRKREGEG